MQNKKIKSLAKYQIRPAAREDLKEVARHTERKRGRQQRYKYFNALELRFLWLAKNPQLGKHRNEIREGIYSFPEGCHIIYFEIQANTVIIVRVLYRLMDIKQQLIDD